MPKLRGSDTDFGHLLKRAFGAAVFCVLEVVVRSSGYVHLVDRGKFLQRFAEHRCRRLLRSTQRIKVIFPILDKRATRVCVLVLHLDE